MDRFAKIALGKVPIPDDASSTAEALADENRLLEVPLPLVTLAAPAWQGMENLLALAEADKETEVGMKLKFDTVRRVEVTLSWVPPRSGVSDGAPEGVPMARPSLEHRHTPLTVIDLEVKDTSPEAVEEMRRVLDAAKDRSTEYAALDFLNTLDGRVVRVLFFRVQQKMAERSFYYLRRQTVRVNVNLEGL